MEERERLTDDSAAGAREGTAGSGGHVDPATVAERTEQEFQEYNERRVAMEAIAGVSVDEAVPFACECDDPTCGGAVELTVAAYQQATAAPDQFVVKPGHEDLDVEVVVEGHDNYLVVSKPHLREPARG